MKKRTRDGKLKIKTEENRREENIQTRENECFFDFVIAEGMK
jgi:hypothetical protein